MLSKVCAALVALAALGSAQESCGYGVCPTNAKCLNKVGGGEGCCAFGNGSSVCGDSCCSSGAFCLLPAAGACYHTYSPTAVPPCRFQPCGNKCCAGAYDICYNSATGECAAKVASVPLTAPIGTTPAPATTCPDGRTCPNPYGCVQPSFGPSGCCPLGSGSIPCGSDHCCAPSSVCIDPATHSCYHIYTAPFNSGSCTTQTCGSHCCTAAGDACYNPQTGLCAHPNPGAPTISSSGNGTTATTPSASTKCGIEGGYCSAGEACVASTNGYECCPLGPGSKLCGSGHCCGATDFCTDPFKHQCYQVYNATAKNPSQSCPFAMCGTYCCAQQGDSCFSSQYGQCARPNAGATTTPAYGVTGTTVQHETSTSTSTVPTTMTTSTAPVFNQCDMDCNAKNETCCHFPAAPMTCCPLPNAICCSDRTSCCPATYQCRNGGCVAQNNEFVEYTVPRAGMVPLM